MRISDFQFDSPKEIEGVWVDVEERARIKVARFGNPRFQSLFDKLVKQRRRRSRSLSAEDVLECQREAAASTILLDLEGFEHDDGKPVSYTPEIGKEWFKVPAFWSLVLTESQLSDNFAEEHQEESEGNSSTFSDGITDGVEIQSFSDS